MNDSIFHSENMIELLVIKKSKKNMQTCNPKNILIQENKICNI